MRFVEKAGCENHIDTVREYVNEGGNTAGPNQGIYYVWSWGIGYCEFYTQETNTRQRTAKGVGGNWGEYGRKYF